MADFDEDDWNNRVEDLDDVRQRIDEAPAKLQLLGRFTVVCLILNRTIGSGIFVTPLKVLLGTGSVGGSLLLWTFGAFVGTCGLLVWLELGLSVPLRDVQVVPGIFEPKSVPRSGGEKNYLEFIYTNPRTGRPKFLVTCMYGVVFILLGNLSGNAVSLGSYVMDAAGKQNPPKRDVIGIAIAALTITIMLHIFSRRGGIMINNFFAVTKVLILLVIIVLGFVKASGDKLGGAPPSTDDFAPDKSFQTNRHDVVSYTDSLLYVVYTYFGFEQPFYVLSEVSRPRKVFPKYTLIAMLITATLFVLVNIAYFCAVPKDLQGIAQAQDMATLFFGQMFGDAGAKRVMAALIAYSIFGNIVVMTFTAARVKQEIAKEGILPHSLLFATAHTTAFAHLKNRWFPNPRTNDEHLEQAPLAALGLHWVSSVFLIAITSMLDAGTAYSVLVSLYSYVIIVLNGFFVAGGLLLLKFTPSKNWTANTNITFWLNPLHAIVYFVVCGFLLFAAFAKPSAGSPYSSANLHFQWYIVPAIGLSTLTWGILWWGGLRLVMLTRMKELVVTRHALVVPDKKVPGQFIQKAEIVGHEWHTKVPSSHWSVNEHEMDRMA